MRVGHTYVHLYVCAYELPIYSWICTYSAVDKMYAVKGESFRNKLRQTRSCLELIRKFSGIWCLWVEWLRETLTAYFKCTLHVLSKNSKSVRILSLRMKFYSVVNRVIGLVLVWSWTNSMISTPDREYKNSSARLIAPLTFVCSELMQNCSITSDAL